MQRNQERQLVKLLVADGNAVDIHTCDDGVRVGTLRNPVVSGQGVSVLKALIMAASRKKRYVREKKAIFRETNMCIDDYEYNYEHLGEVDKPTVEGMMALILKRTNIQVYYRSREIHILTKVGAQIQGHGDTLFKALADALRNLKAHVKRHDVVYREILDDIEMYEQHYGEIV